MWKRHRVRGNQLHTRTAKDSEKFCKGRQLSTGSLDLVGEKFVFHVYDDSFHTDKHCLSKIPVCCTQTNAACKKKYKKNLGLFHTDKRSMSKKKKKNPGLFHKDKRCVSKTWFVAHWQTLHVKNPDMLRFKNLVLNCTFFFIYNFFFLSFLLLIFVNFFKQDGRSFTECIIHTIFFFLDFGQFPPLKEPWAILLVFLHQWITLRHVLKFWRAAMDVLWNSFTTIWLKSSNKAILNRK